MTIQDRIETLLDLGTMTKWEESFVSAILDKLHHNPSYVLSEHELEKLEEIEDQRL